MIEGSGDLKLFVGWIGFTGEGALGFKGSDGSSFIGSDILNDFFELSNEVLRGDGDRELLPNEESLFSLDESSLF